jgi:hypothetical protein
MTISAQASAIQQVLQSWAQPRAGVASVSFDVYDMWETASKQSQVPRILIAYAGEEIRGDFSVAAALHRVDRQWQVAVTRGRGFTIQRGDTLILTNQNAEPFYDSVEYVRDICRCLTGLSEELPIDFKSVEPMQMGDLIIDGYLIKFSTANDLPNVEALPAGWVS